MKVKFIVKKVFFSFLVVSLLGLNPLTSEAKNDNSQKIDVLVGFYDSPGQSDLAVVEKLGGQIKRKFNIVSAVSASVPENAVSALLKNPKIKAVELDGQVHITSHSVELDNTWGVKHTLAGDVHHNGKFGNGVKVAVIDTGIDYNHPDISSNYFGGYNFVSNNTNAIDDNGHGTHVAGTVAALMNGVGVVGMSPEADLYGLKVLDSLGSGSWSNIIAALDWAVNNGIQITNNSYGSSSNPGIIVEDAFNNSYDAGVLHIASAGNSGNCGGKGNSVGYPARYASVVAVAATNSNDTRPCFSSTGPDVELSAPGVSINSTKLGGGYVQFNGTSMASPHVAGVAALVMTEGVNDISQIRQILRDTAKDLGTSGKDNQYGYGLINVAMAVASAGNQNPPGDDPEEPPSDPENPDDPGTGSFVTVNNIFYSKNGGKNNDRHLTTIITVIDDNSNSVSGAVVSMTLQNEASGSIWSFSGTTSSNGSVSFTLNNAPQGCYETTITNVSVNGSEWNGGYPENNSCN